MSTKRIVALVIGLSYIAFMVGCGYGSIGQEYYGGIYKWHLPIGIFVAMIIPFYFGYETGKD